MQRKSHSLYVTAFNVLLGASALFKIVSGAYAAPVPLTQEQWEKRVAATADDSRKARKVVLDAIYANKTRVVAAAYEKMYNAKPSDVRLGAFGYAAVVSERFRGSEDPAFMPAFRHATSLLQHFCAPEEEGITADVRPEQLYRTRDANAWLAWGDLRLRSGFDVKGAEKAYRKALKLEPEMAEAYWWLANLTIEPYEDAYFKAHVAQCRDYLDRADKLEPALHPFVVWESSYTYSDIAPTRANEARALPLLKEFLRLWPENPHADAIRRGIAASEKMLANRNFR